jgi:hypothetical protein
MEHAYLGESALFWIARNWRDRQIQRSGNVPAQP